MDGTDFTVRQLRSIEISTLASLYHAAWHESHAALQDMRVAQSRDFAFFHDRLKLWQNCTLVAWTGPALVGFASAPGARIEALFVAKDHRASGIGTRLLAAAEVGMRRAGHKHLSLTCVCANTAGRKFYERHGWQVKSLVQLPDAVHKDIFTDHWLMAK